MPDNTIRPAQPEEKLYLRMQQAREFGKEFNEVTERAVMGMPPVEGREPVFIKADPRREKLLRQEDETGARELAEMAKRASEEDIRAQSALKDAEIAELKRQVEELRGKAAEGDTKPPVPAPSAKSEAGIPVKDRAIPEGEPTADWSKSAILNWLAREGMEMPPRKGTLMSKLAVLEHAQAELAKRDSQGVTSESGSEAAGA